MFGMGFMEIFLILLVAIMALGPEKLPSAMVDMVKFFKKIKGGIDEAKSTLDSELNISEMKKEADKFKASINEVKSIANVDLDDLTSIEDDEDKPKKVKKSQKKKEKIKENVEDVVSKKGNISFDKEDTA